MISAFFLRRLFSIPVALAAVTDRACVGVLGYCTGGGNVDVALKGAIMTIGQYFFAFAAGASVLSVVLGGGYMVLSFGDDSRISKGKNGILFGLGGFTLAAAAEMIVGTVARVDLAGPDPVTALMASAVDLVTTVFYSVFFFVIIAAGLRMIAGRGSTEEFGKGRSMLIWAAVGAFVVTFARALVEGFHKFIGFVP